MTNKNDDDANKLYTQGLHMYVETHFIVYFYIIQSSQLLRRRNIDNVCQIATHTVDYANRN